MSENPHVTIMLNGDEVTTSSTDTQTRGRSRKKRSGSRSRSSSVSGIDQWKLSSCNYFMQQIELIAWKSQLDADETRESWILNKSFVDLKEFYHLIFREIERDVTQSQRVVMQPRCCLKVLCRDKDRQWKVRIQVESSIEDVVKL
jgi:hypothetical protein